MIYPQVSLEIWKAKYPFLEEHSAICGACGLTITANIPFITKHYAGLTSAPCGCGLSKTICDSAVTITEEEGRSWELALGNLR